MWKMIPKKTVLPCKVYTIEFDGVRPIICAAILVSINHGWHKLKNETTGEEWKENGGNCWHLSAVKALRDQIESYWKNDAIHAIFEDEKVRFAKLVYLCQMMARIWDAKDKAKSWPKQCGSGATNDPSRPPPEIPLDSPLEETRV
jgi:hypothetical protein